eukprot:1156430-Pelagomonas_calceolata.AAC.7
MASTAQKLNRALIKPDAELQHSHDAGRPSQPCSSLLDNVPALGACKHIARCMLFKECGPFRGRKRASPCLAWKRLCRPMVRQHIALQGRMPIFKGFWNA